MNMKQMKSMISKFRSADLSVIKDADKRAQAEKLQAKQGGFTLLELLVVVAILAIIAGAVISSLDGQEELAAQKTTVHTMAALEENFQIYRVSEKRDYPSGLESLLCSTGVNASGSAPALTAVTAANSSVLGDGLNSNVPRTGGGLTLDLADKLTVVDVPATTAFQLTNNGMTSLRYVDADFCNATTDDDADIDEPALVDVTKPSLIFQNIIEEGGEWEFGAGQAIDLTNYSVASGAIPMAILNEPAEYTGDEQDVIAVFGIGPDTSIVGDYVARAPSDGNTGPDKYSNFSVAIRLAKCGGTDEAEDLESSGCVPGSWVEAEHEIVAILDAGGDGYNDEIAEARGNQEE